MSSIDPDSLDEASDASGSIAGNVPDWGAPGWLVENSSTLRNFISDPRTFVIGILVTWLVTNLVLQPAGWTLAFLDWGFSTAFESIQTSIKLSLGNAGSGIWSAVVGNPDNPGFMYAFFQQLTIAVSGLGIAAPIASGVSVAIIFVVIVTLLYFLVRILIDAIPGGGAFL